MPLDENSLRRCVGCKLKVPRWKFGKDRRMRDGLKSRCRACERERAKRYYHEVVKGRRKGAQKKPPQR